MVEEQVLEQRPGGLGRGRLAGAQLAVDVLERLLRRVDVVLVQGVLDRDRVVEQREDLLLGPAERLQQHRDALPALAVDPDADRVLLVDVELEPRPARGDDLGDVDVAVRGLVGLAAEVDAGRADQLGDDDPLGPVDDEGAALGHHGEVAHEDLLLLDLAGGLVHEHGLDEQRAAEGLVLVLALLLGELLLLEGVLAEVELELLGEVLDRRDLFEDLLQAFGEEPVEGLPLDAHEVGERKDLVELGETDTVADRDERVRQELSPLRVSDGHAWNQGMRNAARQTGSVGMRARSVNPRAGTRSNRPRGYPSRGRRSTRTRAPYSDAMSGLAVPVTWASCIEASTRGSRSATRRLDHPERRSRCRPPRCRAPSPDRWCGSGRRGSSSTLKNSSMSARSSPSRDASDTSEGPGQPLERVDRRRHVPVLVPGQPAPWESRRSPRGPTARDPP